MKTYLNGNRVEIKAVLSAKELKAKVAAFEAFFGQTPDITVSGNFRTKDGIGFYGDCGDTKVAYIGSKYVTLFSNGEYCDILPENPYSESVYWNFALTGYLLKDRFVKGGK